MRAVDVATVVETNHFLDLPNLLPCHYRAVAKMTRNPQMDMGMIVPQVS